MKTTINDLTEMDLKKEKIKAYGAKYYAANSEKIRHIKLNIEPLILKN